MDIPCGNHPKESPPPWCPNHRVKLNSDELSVALVDEDPFARADALERAAVDAVVAESLMAALDDEFALVRRGAVRALGRVGGAEVARVLAECAMRDSSAEVREEAVAALSRLLSMSPRARGVG